MKILRIILLLTHVYNNCNVLTFFVNEYGYKVKPIDKLFQGINKKIVKLTNKKMRIPIFSTYYGYLTETNVLNQIVFPNESTAKEFDFVVTNKITPVFMFPYTIAHWEIADKTKATLYKIKRIKENNQYFWEVSLGALPNDGKIPTLSIILFAKPKNVVYPLGKFKTEIGTQVSLPDAYLKQTLYDPETALFMINISNLFKKVLYQNDTSKKEAYSFDTPK